MVGSPLLVAILAALACVVPAVSEGAIVNTVTSGTASLPNSATPTQVTLSGIDITRAFVVCSTRTANSSGDAGVVHLRSEQRPAARRG